MLKFHLKIVILTAAVAGGGFLFAPPAVHAYPGQDDTSSPGSLALNYRRSSNYWVRQDASIFDAKVVTSPPDTTKLDRRIDVLSVIGAERVLAQKFGLRLNLATEGSKMREGPKDPPYRYVDQTRINADAAFDATFITSGGLEVFMGVVWHYSPRYRRTIDAGTTSSFSEYGTASHFSPRFGVVRRGASWSGGFYYSVGSETTRKFSTVASDNSSIDGEAAVHVPTQMGVFGEFLARKTTLSFEMTAIQAGEGGERSEQGNTVRDDFLRANLSALYPVKGAFGTKLALTHQTLSYSGNGFMNVDTVPFSAVKLLGVYGTSKAHIFGGLMYGLGTDGQSIPEFNARYDVRAYGVTGGVFQPF